MKTHKTQHNTPLLLLPTGPETAVSPAWRHSSAQQQP